jgi:hypothetical protein
MIYHKTEDEKLNEEMAEWEKKIIKSLEDYYIEKEGSKTKFDFFIENMEMDESFPSVKDIYAYKPYVKKERKEEEDLYDPYTLYIDEIEDIEEIKKNIEEISQFNSPFEEVIDFLGRLDESVLKREIKKLNEKIAQESIVELDEIELTVIRKKRNKAIFEFVTWDILFLTFLSTFIFFFFGKPRLVDYIVFLNSMWICINATIFLDLFVATLNDNYELPHQYGGQPITHSLEKKVLTDFRFDLFTLKSQTIKEWQKSEELYDSNKLKKALNFEQKKEERLILKLVKKEVPRKEQKEALKKALKKMRKEMLALKKERIKLLEKSLEEQKIQAKKRYKELADRCSTIRFW